MRILFIGIFFILAGCSPHTDTDVTVIAQTNSYHHDWCGRVNMAKTQIMPLARAQNLHYIPCPLCMK